MIVGLCGLAWLWVSPLLFARRLHITWTASLGLGALAAGAAGTLEAGWRARQLPVRYFRVAHVVAVAGILPATMTGCRWTGWRGRRTWPSVRPQRAG